MTMILKYLLGTIAATVAIISGLFWIKAATVKIVAKPPAEVGVGFGGTPLNVMDHSGVVVSFFETYTLQSKWNSRAAFASAAAAIFGAIAFALPG